MTVSIGVNLCDIEPWKGLLNTLKVQTGKEQNVHWIEQFKLNLILCCKQHNEKVTMTHKMGKILITCLKKD